MSVKKCFKCLKTKPTGGFYRHPQMADGFLGKCITCTKKDVQKRYNSPVSHKKIIAYERRRNKTPERIASKLKYQQKFRKNFPGKNAARAAVATAIEDGRLKRQPCEVCGRKKTEAHHDDYRKKLTVRWLCFRHHREVHGQQII
jgi:hypothetical protein